MFKRAIVSTSAAIIILSVLAVSLLLSPAADSCSVANAQEDNPCLSQDATISAYRLQQLDAQSTITALESQVATLTAENMPGPFEPFRDDFNNNDRGWAVGADADGAVEISEGNLVLTPSTDRELIVFLPEISVPNEFYVEMRIDSRDGIRTRVGFWQGDFTRNQSHRFLSQLSNLGFEGMVFFENLTEITSVERNGAGGAGDVIGLERVSGTYNMYINDSLILSQPVSPFGTELAIYASNFGTGNVQTVEIDYIVLRESR